MTTQAPTEIRPGVFDGEIVAGGEQYGKSKNGHLEIILAVNVPDLARTLSVPMNLSENAAPYSLEKLRYVGWKGDKVTDLSSLYGAKVKVEVRYDNFENRQVMKTQLVTPGSGRITSSEPMDKADFQAQFEALMGKVSSPVVTQTAGTVKPPF